MSEDKVTLIAFPPSSSPDQDGNAYPAGSIPPMRVEVSQETADAIQKGKFEGVTVGCCDSAKPEGPLMVNEEVSPITSLITDHIKRSEAQYRAIFNHMNELVIEANEARADAEGTKQVLAEAEKVAGKALADLAQAKRLLTGVKHSLEGDIRGVAWPELMDVIKGFLEKED